MLSVILSSCPPDAAQQIADTLIGERKAACVSILPEAMSTYRWQGEVQRDRESLLVIKVPTEAVSACVEALQAAHPYEVPEIVVFGADRVGGSYLAWALEQVDRS